MERTDFILHTDRVPILDNRGVQIDEVVLPEKITPVPRRRCGVSEGHTYYKGAGTPIIRARALSIRGIMRMSATSV